MPKEAVALLCLLPSAFFMLCLSAAITMRIGRKRGWWR